MAMSGECTFGIDVKTWHFIRKLKASFELVSLISSGVSTVEAISSTLTQSLEMFTFLMYEKAP